MNLYEKSTIEEITQLSRNWKPNLRNENEPNLKKKKMKSSTVRCFVIIVREDSGIILSLKISLCAFNPF